VVDSTFRKWSLAFWTSMLESSSSWVFFLFFPFVDTCKYTYTWSPLGGIDRPWAHEKVVDSTFRKWSLAFWTSMLESSSSWVFFLSFFLLLTRVSTLTPDRPLVALIAHELSRKADSCKAQELRSLEWSEIKLCMNVHDLPMSCQRLTIVSSFV
jgi:succinate dehydrogenase/fumarate reductase cytochrome b subunit